MPSSEHHRVRGWAVSVAAAVAAVLVALVVTPLVMVDAFGQQFALGSVPPASIRGLSGPGQADLFGEGPVDTRLVFDGVLRPRIVWQRFNADPAAADFVTTSSESGPSLRTQELGDELASGWLWYGVRLIAVAMIAAAGLRLALLGLSAVIWHHVERSRRTDLQQVVASGLLALAIIVASVAWTTASVVRQLAEVRTLADITGTAPLVPPPVDAGVATGARLVVLGDSTAAGVGNAALARPTREDVACDRSSDAYAVVLGRALQAPTVNLACSSATIDAGLLGSQDAEDVPLPAQVGVLKGLPDVGTVVLSVGANDVGWADFIRICYGLERCDDQVVQRLFANRLDTFRVRYAQLLQQLGGLVTHPRVVVVQYYDPFGDRFDCPALHDPATPLHPPTGFGFAGADQDLIMRTKIEPMRSNLAALNDVIARGAQAFGFATATPTFAGHGLCSDQPWVQGLGDRFPFHPNAAGELAIAAAVLPHVTTQSPVDG